MKLVYQLWNKSISFDDSFFKIIAVEDPKTFSGIIQDLIYEKANGNNKFILSHDEKIYDIKKDIEIILTPFAIEGLSKKISAAIVKEMKRIAINEEYDETQKLISNVLRYLYKLADSSEYNVLLDDDLDLEEVIKICHPCLDIEGKTLFERIVDYIEALHMILKTVLIICVNFSAYLSIEEIKLLKKEMEVKRIPILLLERLEENATLQKEACLIIDKDLCEI